MKKIGVIINPNAKKFRTGRSSINDYLTLQSDNVIIKSPANHQDLSKTVKLFKKINPDYICAAGGDGTIHLIISGLLNTYKSSSMPPILILKEGTMDNIARSVQLKGRGPVLLQRLIKSINENRCVSVENRYTIKINDKYCFLFGTGLVTNFLNKAYSGGEKGFMKNLMVGFTAVREGLFNIKNGNIFKLTDQEIFIDGAKIGLSSLYGILAGTVEHVGMGFSPLADAVQPDGTFQMILLALPPNKILANINKLRTGKKISSTGYMNVIGKSLIIKQKDYFEYTMDGDIYSAYKKLEIKTGPVIKLVKI